MSLSKFLSIMQTLQLRLSNAKLQFQRVIYNRGNDVRIQRGIFSNGFITIYCYWFCKWTHNALLKRHAQTDNFWKTRNRSYEPEPLDCLYEFHVFYMYKSVILWFQMILKRFFTPKNFNWLILAGQPIQSLIFYF